jgi:hypothetical protein
MKPFEEYWNQLVRVCIDRHLTLVPLGKTGRQVMWMVKNRTTRNRHLLIVAGTHGEEIAGPLGILSFLESASIDILHQCELSIIPVVSPIAFGKRRNSYIKPNCGFVQEVPDRLSIEGKVLDRNMPLLITASRDGLLNLHETADETRWYLYLMGENWGVARDLVHVGKKYFEVIAEGEPMREPRSQRAMAWNGIVHNCLDGSLDHRLWIEGCPVAITTETPGLKPLTKRVECNSELIKTFIEMRG